MNSATHNGLAGVVSIRPRRWAAPVFGKSSRLGAMSLIDQAVVSGTRFLTSVIVGRACGATALGCYALAFSVVVFFGVLQETLITSPYAVLAANRTRGARRRYAGSLLIHVGVLAGVAAMLLAIVGTGALLFAGSSQLTPAVWVLAAILPFALLREFARRLAFANLQVAKALTLDVVVAVVQLGGLVLLAATHSLTVHTAFLALAVACAAGGVCWWATNRQTISVRRSQVLSDLTQNLSFGRWICGSQLISVVNGYAVYWLLLLVSATATGIFTACATVVMLANPFILGIGNIVAPQSARAFAQGGASQLRRFVRNVTLVVCGFMGVFWITVVVAGKWILTLLFNDQALADQGLTLSVLCSAIVIGAAGMGFGSGLKAIRRPQWNFIASLLDLIVVLVACVPLILGFGVLGAAFAVLCGSLAGTACRFSAFSRLVNNAELE